MNSVNIFKYGWKISAVVILIFIICPLLGKLNLMGIETNISIQYFSYMIIGVASIAVSGLCLLLIIGFCLLIKEFYSD